MTSDQQEIFTIDNVSAGYNGTPVITGINLRIRKGETFGLIGLNGAGKTTLIKSALGLRQYQAGEIRLFGKDSTDKAGRYDLAYLPERFDPPWFLTGLEFLKFSLRLYKQKFRVEEVYDNAEKLALDPAALKRRVHTYSKGMRQKLGLLGTVMTECNLMILDEPMSGLDPLARTRVKDMLMLSKTRGKTIFLSSHILSDMEEICDRVAVLHDGILQYVGTPQNLRAETRSENLERAFLHFVEKSKAA